MYKPDQNTRSRIDRNFATRELIDAPGIGQAPRLQSIRDGLRRESCRLLELCPPGRELNIALTKLEEAQMWAERAIVAGEELKQLEALAEPEAEAETEE